MDAGTQSLRSPQRVARLAQARFFGGGHARLGQTLPQRRSFGCKRLQEVTVCGLRKRSSFAGTQVFHPLRNPRNWSNNCGTNNQQGDEHNQQNFCDHVPQSAAPDIRTLRFNVARIVKSNQNARQRCIAMKRQGIGVHRRTGDGRKAAHTNVTGFAIVEYFRRNVGAAAQLGAAGQQFSLRIVDGDTGKVFAVSKPLDDATELYDRSSHQDRFGGFLQAFGQDFGAAREVGTQAAFFRTHLVTGHDERNQADADHE